MNVWITLYKLTGWLASLDLRQPHITRILSHRTASPHALFDVLGLDGGRGKTVNDLVDRDREPPANKAALNKAKLHTDTHMRTYTKVQSKTKQSKRNENLTLKFWFVRVIRMLRPNFERDFKLVGEQSCGKFIIVWCVCVYVCVVCAWHVHSAE